MTNNRRYKYDDELFTREDDISYYLLGLMMTDGCVFEYNPGKYYLTLGLCDFYFLKKVHDLMAPKLAINKKKDRQFWRFKANNKNYTDWLIENGCVPNKTLILKFPDKIPDEYMPDFIRGVMDGDGSITFSLRELKNNKKGKRIRCYVCSSSFNFISGVAEYLDSLNIKFKLNTEKAGKISKATANTAEIKSKNDNYRTSLNHKEAYKLLKIIYYPGNRLCLDRKQILANEIINYYENDVNEHIENISNDKHYAAKFSNEQVLQIRNDYNSKKFKTKSKLIIYYNNKLGLNVNKCVYYDILKNKTYKILNNKGK